MSRFGLRDRRWAAGYSERDLVCWPVIERKLLIFQQRAVLQAEEHLLDQGRPGLVGGHCISVDPYYLTHKAQQVGHHPDVILAGRRTNDGMGTYIASEVVRLMVRKGINPVRARVLILGLAFKENCPDLRNTRVVDIINALDTYGVGVDVHDPWVRASEAEHEYGITPMADPARK